MEVLIHFRKISKGKKSVEKNQIWLYLCKYRFWISFLTGSVYEYLANEQLVQKIITSENFEKKNEDHIMNDEADTNHLVTSDKVGLFQN